MKNANGGTLEPGGSFGILIPPEDLTTPDPADPTTRYAALLVWTWEGGQKTARARHSFAVADLEQTP